MLGHVVSAGTSVRPGVKQSVTGEQRSVGGLIYCQGERWTWRGCWVRVNRLERERG